MRIVLLALFFDLDRLLDNNYLHRSVVPFGAFQCILVLLKLVLMQWLSFQREEYCQSQFQS